MIILLSWRKEDLKECAYLDNSSAASADSNTTALTVNDQENENLITIFQETATVYRLRMVQGNLYLIYGSNPATTGDTLTALFPPREKTINESSKDLKPVKKVKF